LVVAENWGLVCSIPGRGGRTNWFARPFAWMGYMYE
jgi:hypothetical protein